jgi:hypothetical protein
MKRLLAALVAMTGCATDDVIEQENASNQSVEVHTVDCMPVMSVIGAGPYSVQCAVAYSVSDAGAQIEYVATDANGATWVSARAAAPMATSPDIHAVTVFAVENMTVPAGDALTVKTKVVDVVQSVASNEISATIAVRH